MADLDGDLQGGGRGSSAASVATFTQRDGDLQSPQGGAYESEASSCTCEVETATIHTVGVTATASYLDIEFSGNVVLSGPGLEAASWYVTVSGPGRDVAVGSVEVVSATVVRLTVTPQTLDADYTVHLPTIGITSDASGLFTGLYSLDFEGVPTVVTVQMVKVVDTHHLDVIFAIPVSEDTAGDPLNYSIDNDLTVTEATRITDLWYRLRNDPRQVDATSYTITISNIEPL